MHCMYNVHYDLSMDYSTLCLFFQFIMEQEMETYVYGAVTGLIMTVIESKTDA